MPTVNHHLVASAFIGSPPLWQKMKNAPEKMKKAKKWLHWKWKSSYVINLALPEDKRKRHDGDSPVQKKTIFHTSPAGGCGGGEGGNQVSWLVFTRVAGARALSRSFGEISELVLRESGETASWPEGRGATQLAAMSAWSLRPAREQGAAAASLLARLESHQSQGEKKRSPRQNGRKRSLSKAPQHH